MTFVLGLTGSMATGKSTVLAMFADLGVPTYSADQAVHDIYAGPLPQNLAELVPSAVENGAINRTRLSQYLSQHPEKLSALEAIVHPLVRQKSEEFLQNAQSTHEPLVVLEIPLLFETANQYPLNAIAVCWVDENTQRLRALGRPGMNVEKLTALLARQMPQGEKKKRANFLIDTGTDLDTTRARVSQIASACRNGQIPEPGANA